MEFIIDFYKSLDTLNLIIFWGIIIVIILLLVFAYILMNKNKKLKSLVEKNNKKEEEFPIKKEELTKENNKEKAKECIENLENEESIEDSIILPQIPEIQKEKIKESETIDKPIETEKRFIAEEHVIEYNKDLFSLSNIKKTNEQPEEKNKYDIKNKSEIEFPNKPYQRNVLREMSLGQTSPIGITTRVNKEEKKMKIAKDLEESLNNKQEEISTDNYEQVKKQKEKTEKEYKKEAIENKMKEVNIQIKKELSNVENISPRKTEIKIENSEKDTANNERLKKENIINDRIINDEIMKEKEIKQAEIKPTIEKTNMTSGQLSAKELLNKQPIIHQEKTNRTASEKYLEEVSRKLAEAEIPDEIERTDYELEQEENAIISYKELMEKKDSIQTIDEEEAIISIEELMNRNNQKSEEIKEDAKLYKLTEEEENDDFINELKQFRNDL